ncbi:hypothetical protein ACP4OV_005573 [Aristida adscensionis]
MARPHVVVVPYPFPGNVNPALQLAKLLHRHGVYVTFVNTEHNHRCVLAAAAVRGGDGFRFEAIPDGLSDADRGARDYGLSLLVSTSRRCAAPLRDLIARLNDGTPGTPPVTCVVTTGMMAFAVDVARELGIPAMVLWCGGAASLMVNMRIRELKERGYVPLKDKSLLTNGYLEETVIDWIPGMPPTRLADMPSFVRTTDPDDVGLRVEEADTEKSSRAGALILNTFEALDADILAALRAEYPRVYAVGPLGSLLRRRRVDGGATDDSIGLSLWKQDAGCLAWLDTQERGAFVYVNFGSHAVLTPEQLAEFAWGLAVSGHPFLWSVRDDGGAVTGGLVAALAAETCRVAGWCPQEEVLQHPAVGCFVTHGGWNSTCESVAAGVPMVCWPGFGDQFTNAKYACEVWGVGVRLDAEVRREQVAERVREVMGSPEMRASAARWKAKAEVAACPSGSAYEDLQSLVRALSSSTGPAV